MRADTASVTRTTKETDVRRRAEPRRRRRTATADTGLPFFDHMLQQLGKHAGWDLDVDVQGRPRGRRPPHGRGRRHRAGAGAERGARRQGRASGGSPRSRCRSTRPRSRSRSTCRAGTFVVYEVAVPAETIGTFDTGLVEDFVRAFAQSRRAHDPRPTEGGPLAAPRAARRRSRAWRRRSAMRVQPHRTRRRHPQHERHPVTDTTIAVLDYGMGNLLSVSRALGASAADAGSPATREVRARRRPGRSRASATSARACAPSPATGSTRPCATSSAAGKPVFGVCVGMQVLFEGSDEDAERRARRLSVRAPVDDAART